MYKKNNTVDSLLVTFIAFLPIVVYWVFREYFADRGLWFFYDHIEVLYYVSGIEIALGFSPTNVDNPGSLAQLSSALLIYFLGDDPSKYSTFIYAAHALLLVLSFISTLILIYYLSSNIDWKIRVASIWCFFSFSVSLTYLRVFGPEPFYYIVGLFAVCALIFLSFNYERKANISFLLFGGSIGALISVKFTFLAWLPGLYLLAVLSPRKLFSLQSIQNVFFATVGVFAAFLLITFKARESYSYMFGWIFRNVARDGSYGSGTTSLPDLSDALLNWQTLFFSNKVWLCIFVFLIVSVAAPIVRNRLKSHKGEILVLTFILTSVLFTMLFVVRSYQHRYMLPIGLCGIALVLLLPRINIGGKLSWLVLVVFFTTLVKSMYNDYSIHVKRVASSNALLTNVGHLISDDSNKQGIANPLIVYGWRMPHPALSLRQHSVKGPNYILDVDQLYPNAGHYTPWINGNTFRLPNTKKHWDYAILRPNDLQTIKGINYNLVASIDGYEIIRADR